MESMGAILEGEWSSFCGMYTNEEADFMAQLLSNCPSLSLPDELNGNSNLGIPSTFWLSHHSTEDMTGGAAASYPSSDLGSSYSAGSSVLFPSSSQESYYLSDSQPIFVANNSPISMDFSMEDATNTSSYLIETDDCLNLEMRNGNVETQDGKKQQQEPALPKKNVEVEPKRESEMPQPEPITEKKSNNISENSKKRYRSSGDVQKNRKNARSKKNQSNASTTNNDNEDGNAALNVQSSASCSSEDDSNASQELNGGVTSTSKGEAALNLNGKTRAGRGAATDPQSLYARKRRERINERLRILQNLVPNGTKVDISTMLEEAVQYVKFLQLQIKLLSSDDLWMYAPIAYNGMDIGLDLKIATPKRS